jgi:nucleoside-diphosphate-sugar epimerase
MDTKSIKVGITGAGGFIGRELYSYLSSKGYAVSGFTSNKVNSDLVYLDMMNKEQIKAKFVDLDILINLAWIGSDRRSRSIPEIQKKNVLIVENIIKILKFTNISRIFGIGSQDELLNGGQPWSDNSKISPLSEYAKAKFDTFNLFTENSKNFTWARLFSVYGVNDQRDWILTKAINAIHSNSSITFGRCSKPWSLTHVSDVVTAFEMLIKNNIIGAVNISNLDAPLLRNHLELMQSISKKELFTFLHGDTVEREVSRSNGILESIGWKPNVTREEGFLDLLK